MILSLSQSGAIIGRRDSNGGLSADEKKPIRDHESGPTFKIPNQYRSTREMAALKTVHSMNGFTYVPFIFSRTYGS